MSNLWIAYNGYAGDGLVSCIVLGNTEEDAKASARETFRLNWNTRAHGESWCEVTEIEQITLPYFMDA